MRRLAKVTLLSGALLCSLALTPLLWNLEAVAEDSSPGQEAFLAAKCNMCHAVSSVGIEAKMKSPKMMGPDLKGLSGRADKDTVIKYMKKEAKINDTEHKKEWKGSEEDLAALVDWLQEQ